ncbi:hypothetical protein EDD11_006640 [Mortierella claussenii]|nr:hypothetical protein EDD11_006640 [Mortierella claussenii]
MLNSNRQYFQSGADSFEAPVSAGNSQTDGRPFVLWDDIRHKVPGPARFQREKRTVTFMTDSSGTSLEPLRIEYRPESTIEIILDKSVVVPPPQHHSDGRYYHSKAPKYLPEGYFEKEAIQDDKDTRHQKKSNLTSSASSSEAKKDFSTSVQMYERYVQSMKQGQSDQASAIKNNFRDQYERLVAEMSRHRDLQQQMQQMQQAMLEMQIRPLDRLAPIQSRAQTILMRNLGWREYRMPRLFIVLPKKGANANTSNRDSGKRNSDSSTSTGSSWDSGIGLWQDMFRLYFLCECGTHTRSSKSNKVPHHIHLARHDGYDIENETEFFRQYGHHALTLLQMLKYGLTVGGYSVPAMAQRTIGAVSRDGDWFDGNTHAFSPAMVQATNQAIEHLQNMCRHGHFSTSTTVSTVSTQPSAQDDNQDPLDLAPFLRTKESCGRIGDLHRIMSKEGHVKWVCEEHYQERHGHETIQELYEFMTIHHGSFDQYLGRIDVSLPTPDAAAQLYRIMDRSRFVQELKITFMWEATRSDLKALRDAIFNSRVVSLDLTCTPSNATSELLNGSKRSDALWQMIGNPRLQSFTLNDYVGFFSRMSVIPTANNLRVLRITESVDWRRDGSKVIDLLRLTPRLTELHLGCNNVEDTYASIRRTTTGFCPLEQLVLDGGTHNGMLAKFHNGEPVFMDLMVADFTSPLLLGAKGLQTLHVRPLVACEIDRHILESIVYRNPILTKLKIWCPTSTFRRALRVIKDAVGSSRESELHSVSLYHNRNLLHATNMKHKMSIRMELMTTNIPSETLTALLKAYGPRMTKFKVEGESYKGLSLLSMTLRHTGSILSRLEIVGTIPTPTALRDLQMIIKTCQSSLSHLSIAITTPWQGTRTDSDLANFVVEFSPSWTEFIGVQSHFTAWKIALSRRGFFVSDKIITLVTIPPGFADRSQEDTPEAMYRYGIEAPGKKDEGR